MNDQATGDMAWQTSPIGLTPAAPARQPRQQRKAREATPKKLSSMAQEAVKAAEKGLARGAKKPRAAKAERAAPDTIKVTLKEFAQMRVGDDAKLFLKLHGVLSSAGKASRTKVLAELSKVFT